MRIPWNSGRWTHDPVAVVEQGEDLAVTAVEGSDAWRHTSYGFVHESEHALVAPFAVGSAVEVEFTAEFTGEFDQAGLFIQAAVDRWVKAGVEFADGVPMVGAVVTNVNSDWSVAPVPEWSGARILVRASRANGALTIRVGPVGEPLRLVRVLPFADEWDAEAGPMICAPTRAGLTVIFHEWRVTDADGSLH